MNQKFYQCQSEEEAENLENFLHTETIPAKDFPFSKPIYESIIHYKSGTKFTNSVGYVSYKDRIVYYPHVLNKKDERLNFFDEVRPAFASFPKLHRYFSHLDSSQALAMNFFGLLILHPESHESFSKSLIGLIRQKGVKLPTDLLFCPQDKNMQNYFEKKKADDSEIDVELPFRRNDGTLFTVFIEVKYSEKEIGKMGLSGKNGSMKQQQSERDHIAKYNQIYLPAFQLTDKMTNWRTKTKEQQAFVDHYQFFRNVLLTKNKNDAIALFLTPREFNPSVDASIESSIKAFNAIVPLSIQPQFHFAHIYWEDLLKELQNEPTFQLVESKYFFPMFSGFSTRKNY
jgi:hypothetical protein